MHHTRQMPSFYVHAPALTDSAAAPTAGTIYALMPVVIGLTKQDWTALVTRSRNHLYRLPKIYG